jgi:hypothetical protein
MRSRGFGLATRFSAENLAVIACGGLFRDYL